MANRKAYGYYLRGGQIALVEQDSILGSGQTLTPPALNDVGSDGDSLWKSPLTSATKALEIEYAYSPRYVLPGSAGIDLNAPSTRFISGWMAVYDSSDEKSYLNLLRTSSNISGTPLTIPFRWDLVSPAVGDYIYIGGSSRWNGAHKVKSRGSTGRLVLETVVSSRDVTFSDNYNVNTTFEFEADDNTVFDGGSGSLTFLADHFSAGDYVWIEQGSNNVNNGLFSVSSITTAATAAASKIVLGTKYGVATSGAITADGSVGLDEEYSVAASLADVTAAHHIFAANREFCYITIGVGALTDERDTIDLPEYLSKALVYYVKAKLAEDENDPGKKDFFMKEYYRIIEKHESSKIWGARMISPGPNAIR